MQNLKFRNKSFKSNFSLILFIYNLMIECSKKGIKNFSPEKAFEQEKKIRRLKFNPGLCQSVFKQLGPVGPSPPLPSPLIGRPNLLCPTVPRHKRLCFGERSPFQFPFFFNLSLNVMFIFVLQSLLQSHSEWEKDISKDLSRTFPFHQMFCEPDGPG